MFNEEWNKILWLEAWQVSVVRIFIGTSVILCKCISVSGQYFEIICNAEIICAVYFACEHDTYSVTFTQFINIFIRSNEITYDLFLRSFT
jgi:hypothetical protein